MQSTADRGGPFDPREVRNWMRASPPGISFRYPKTDSSPVGGGVPRSNSRKRARKWVAAVCLTVGVALTGDALYIHAKALVAQALAQMPFIHGSMRRAMRGDIPPPQIVGVPEAVIRQNLRAGLPLMEQMEQVIVREARTWLG